MHYDLSIPAPKRAVLARPQTSALYPAVVLCRVLCCVLCLPAPAVVLCCVSACSLLPGKLFHSGLPHKSINPLELLMDAVLEIQQRFYRDFPAHQQEAK